MKKVLFSAFMIMAAYLQTHAQGVERQMGTSAGASQIFLEGGGLGIVYSVNFDKRFKKEENGLGFRVGIGGASADGDGYFTIPVQVNYLYGNNGQYLELGAGASYFSISDFFDNNGSNSTVFTTATIGFRKVPFAKKGLTWRVAFNPFIGQGGFMPWFGASLGYRF